MTLNPPSPPCYFLYTPLYPHPSFRSLSKRHLLFNRSPPLPPRQAQAQALRPPQPRAHSPPKSKSRVSMPASRSWLHRLCHMSAPCALQQRIQEPLDSLLETKAASLPKTAGKCHSQHSRSLALTSPERSVLRMCVSRSSRLWELEGAPQPEQGLGALFRGFGG